MTAKTVFKMGMMVISITLIAAGLLLGPSLLAKKAPDTPVEKQETPVYSVRTITAQKRTLTAFLDVNGDIVSAQQADVFPDVAGKLVGVQVSLGSYVRKGDVIAEVDPSRPGAVYMKSRVLSPISGIVSKTPLSAGVTVNQNTSITVISVNDNLEINARIPEREIAGLAAGLKAQVSLQAYPGEVFAATVNRVSPILDNISRTKLVNLKFEKNDSRINAGMFARVRINTLSYKDVLVVPAEAVISKRDVNTVYVIGSGESGLPTAEKREVACGVTLQGWTEIKSGLIEGETLVIQGQQLLNGGEHLRIIGEALALENVQ